MSQKKTNPIELSKGKTLSLPDMIANDIREVADSLHEEPYSLGWWQYHNGGGKHGSFIPNIGSWTVVRNTYFPKPIDGSTLIRLTDIKSTQARLVKSVGRLDNLVADFTQAIKEMPSFNPSSIKYNFSGSHIDTDRAVNLVLSDLHFGSDLKATATNKAFGVVEEARAFAQVVKTVCEFKRDYRNKTELHIWLLGDIIEGNIHVNGVPSVDVTEQFKRALWLLEQGLTILLKEYKQVYVHCVTGNHDRNPSLHRERAIDNKESSYSTMLYYALSRKFADISRIKFQIPNSPEVVANVLGHRFYATHGDTLLKTGNIGQTIKTGLIESEINSIDRNEVADGRNPFDVYLVGHVHKATVMALDFGGTLVINGGLPPANNYAKSVRVHRAHQCQCMFEATKTLGFGDYRRIYVSGTENNKELDKIIKPWSNS